MMTKMFSGITQETQECLDLKIQMTDLEELLSKEMRTWWDLSTLQSYVDKKMIPRGLRLKKFPSTVYNEDFKQQWENTLTNCSMELMRLIISQEEHTLKDIRLKIVTLQDIVKEQAESDAFNNLDQHMQENLDKLEKIITDTKQSKFMRDLQDYKTGFVYLWNKQTSNTPRSIMRKSYKRKHRTPGKVLFSSTDAESSDTSEPPGDQPMSGGAKGGQKSSTKNKRQQDKQSTKSNPSSSSKNALGNASGEPGGSTDKQDRYPRRNRNK